MAETRNGMGVHPTPPSIVEEFADFVATEFSARMGLTSKGPLRLLDLFAGDGRLGRAVARRLEQHGRVSLTSVEIDESQANIATGTIIADALGWESPDEFDLVVANPPFGRLTRQRAGDLGIEWEDARAGAQNLYGVGILRCLDLCRPGGTVGVISPFGWLRGARGTELRAALESRCEKVTIVGSSDRVRFDGPQQDTGFHLLTARNGGARRPAPVFFGFERDAVARVARGDAKDMSSEEWRVRVGGLVWNRCRDVLSPRRRRYLPVLYGGNIRPSSIIDFNVERYRTRQFVPRSKVSASMVTEGPYLGLRRTLRGRPGDWTVDLAVGVGPVVAENHVIVVQPAANGDLESLREGLTAELQAHIQQMGSPSLGVTTVRAALGRFAGGGA